MGLRETFLQYSRFYGKFLFYITAAVCIPKNAQENSVHIRVTKKLEGSRKKKRTDGTILTVNNKVSHGQIR